MTLAGPTLRLSEDQYRRIVGQCYDGLPDEACGLLSGPVDLRNEPTGLVTSVHPCANADASAVTYTVDSRDLIRAMRDAESRGEELVGVWHSHTHTDPYPSETDILRAADPTWLYVLVSLRDVVPTMRCYRIRDGVVAETAIVIDG
jgi:proteasome lid subunit RPN8/RPN11